MSETLPKGWFETTLNNIADWGSGGTPSRTNPAFYNGDIPWVKTGELGQRYLEDTEEKISNEAIKCSSAKLFPKGSVAIAMYGATIGKTSILNINAATNQACAVGIPNDATDSIFLYYFLVSEKQRFVDMGKGGAQPNISQQLIKNHSIPLPPLNEQKRIVAKLDQIMPRIAAVEERLNKMPAIVKRFRQSLLTAAITGKLTEKWRAKHLDVESSNSLLIKIIEEKPFSKKLKQQSIGNGYNENLYELPIGWSWTMFHTACDKIFDGTHFSPQNYKEGDYMYITAKNIKENRIDLNEITYVSKEDHKNIYQRADVKYNDVFYIKDGATAGIATVNKINEEFSTLSSIGMFRVNQKYIVPEYVSFYLNAPITKKRMLDMISGVAITRLTLVKLNNSYLALPPFEEQKEIVCQVEKFFALADKLESHFQKAKVRVDKLLQSVLAKAFHGELVITEAELAKKEDRDFESAEKLLERILEEKAKLVGSRKSALGRKKIKKIETWKN